MTSPFPPEFDPGEAPAALPPRSRLRVPLGWRIALGGLLAVGAIAGACVAYVAALLPETPSIADLKQVQVSHPSVLQTEDGQVLAVFRRSQQAVVALADVSPNVVQALLATEDRRFYDHHGLDFKRTAGAFWNTVNGDMQGGSTITQQLARNLFPQEIGRSRNLNRKLKEMVMAVRIERVYTKPEILERYLNTAPFLYNAVGIEMAARTYFGKPAKNLDAAEAATLVGMLKGTHYYNPVLYPDRALKRRNLVLQQMVKAGSLTEADYGRYRDEPLHVTLTRQDDDLGSAPHFAAYARRFLLDWAEKNDVDLYADGLVIQTTLDSHLQQAATDAVARQSKLLQNIADVEWSQPSVPISTSPDAYATMHKGEPYHQLFVQHPELLSSFLRETPEYKQSRQHGETDVAALQALKSNAAVMARVRKDKTRLEAGFVAMDPNTGEVKAWVGSRDFQVDQFDHVAQAERQPGSTFKPIVYGAALEAGIAPDHTYMDGPIEVKLDDNTVWRPTDMHASSGEMTTLRDGLVYSKNNITAQVGQEVGVAHVVSLARAMGVDTSKLDPVPSLALGTSPVTLLEMVDAYSTIAAQGTRHKPVFIRRITAADGKVLVEFTAEPRRAMATESADDLIDMMRGVVNRGTGTAIKTRFGITADVAGKTGTTQYNTDGWFILMHPNLVAGAWVGFDDQRVTMRGNYWGQGGHNAILLVGDFYRDALKDKLIDAAATFPPPSHPVLATLQSDEAGQDGEDSYGQIGDYVPGGTGSAASAVAVSGAASDASRMPANAATIVVATPADPNRDDAGSVIVVGDGPGVDAMTRSDGPPKSAQETQALGDGHATDNAVSAGQPAANAVNAVRGSDALLPPSAHVSTSGTEAGTPDSLAHRAERASERSDLVVVPPDNNASASADP